MTTQEFLDILRQGIDVWNQWRIDNPEEEVSLAEAKSGAGFKTTVNLLRKGHALPTPEMKNRLRSSPQSIKSRPDTKPALARYS